MSDGTVAVAAGAATAVNSAVLLAECARNIEQAADPPRSWETAAWWLQPPTGGSTPVKPVPSELHTWTGRAPDGSTQLDSCVVTARTHHARLNADRDRVAGTAERGVLMRVGGTRPSTGLGMQSEITHAGDELGPAAYYALRVVWFVAAALFAQVVAAIIVVWRNPT